MITSYLEYKYDSNENNHDKIIMIKYIFFQNSNINNM